MGLIFPESKFQFQYGTIKSKPVVIYHPQDEEFQFQYGTIKRNTYNFYHKADWCFNSNMVRLKEVLGFGYY